MLNIKRDIDYFFENCKELPCLKNRSTLTLKSMSNFYVDAITRYI